MRKATSRSSKPVLLAGGNPQIAKADGDSPVQAYISSMPEWKRDIGRRLDDLIVRAVPGVHKAVRWNSPMYGVKGQGWFLSFHVFTKYVKVTFFKGTSLQPVPPGGGGQGGSMDRPLSRRPKRITVGQLGSASSIHSRMGQVIAPANAEQRPNPSIERTVKSTLRMLSSAAHVKR